MPSPRTLPAAAVAASLALLSGTAQATMLTFTGISQLGPSTGSEYGDRVTVAGTGIGLEGGATPNIVLDFVPTSTGTPFSVWASGYASLSSALGHVSFNVKGYVEFTPDPGWDVVLTSFDVAGWSSSAYPDSRVRVVDAAGTTLFDTGSFTFPVSTVQSFLPVPIRSSQPLRLVVDDFGDLAIDNVLFSQVATIPEPGTWALWLAGVGVLGTLARRRARG
ncbi:MAG: PEP-CTERM sorting domain-containing protein [Betaproteobacteria bacterium]|jgi:MYXO-CTERM domain-containing protein